MTAQRNPQRPGAVRGGHARRWMAVGSLLALALVAIAWFGWRGPPAQAPSPGDGASRQPGSPTVNPEADAARFADRLRREEQAARAALARLAVEDAARATENEQAAAATPSSEPAPLPAPASRAPAATPPPGTGPAVGALEPSPSRSGDPVAAAAPTPSPSPPHQGPAPAAADAAAGAAAVQAAVGGPAQDARLSPDAQTQARIDTLLKAARSDAVALRLTSPAGRNAVEKYREVLRLDPGNVAAEAGLDDVVNRYLELVDKVLAKQQPDKALRFLDRAASLRPASPRVQAARARVEATR